MGPRTLISALLALAAAAAPAVAAGPDGLSLPAERAAGFRGAPAAPAAAVAEIGTGLATPARRVLRAGTPGATRLVGSGARALTGGVLLGSSGEARRVTAAWRRAADAPRPAPGVAGGLIAGGDGTVRVLLTSGRAVGIVRVDGRGARPRALALARALGSGIRTAGAWSAWDVALSEVRPDGTVPVATALEGFQIAYGVALPGAPPVTGPPGVVRSGTQVIGWVRQNWGALTPAQRDVVETVLGVPAGSLGPVAGTARITGRPSRRTWSTVTPSERLDALRDAYVERFQRELGVSMRMGIEIGWFPLAGASADAYPYTVDGRAASLPAEQHTCQVRVSRGNGNQEAGYLENTVAHEVFHCFQFQLAPIGWQREGNDWLMEGQAEWAADTVAPVRLSTTSARPEKYFGVPHRPLFARGYDAGFFWGRLSETTGPLWGRIRVTLDAVDNPSAYAASGATAPAFADAWASSLLRRASAGPAWTTDAPFPVPSGAVPAAVESEIGTTVKVDPYANRIARVAPAGSDNVVRVELTRGSLRATDGTLDLPIPASAETTLCLGGRCTCRNGDAPALVRMDGPVHLALSGATTGGRAEITRLSIDDLCDDPGPEECSTSRPLVMPRTRAAFVAWYRRASEETVRRAEAIPPFTQIDRDLRRRLDATAGAEPGEDKDRLVESLKDQIRANNGRAFDQSCRFYELVAQGNRVTIRATRLGYLTRSAEVARAFREFNAAWSGAQRAHQEDLGWPSRFPPF